MNGMRAMQKENEHSRGKWVESAACKNTGGRVGIKKVGGKINNY